MRDTLLMLHYSPEFLMKKVMKAAMDDTSPFGFHGTLKTWDQLKPAPILYLAQYEGLSLSHIAQRIDQVGDTITGYVHELEYPREIPDDRILFYEGLWNLEAREQTEWLIKNRRIAAVSYLLNPPKLETQCLAIRKKFVRLINTYVYEITKLKELSEGVKIEGSNVRTVEPYVMTETFDIRLVETIPHNKKTTV